MLLKRIFLTICLLNILNSGCAKTTMPAHETSEKQHSNNSNINNLDIKDIRSKAEKGDPESQYNMGVIYADGYKEIQPDIVEAIKWYTLSAEQGYAKAKYNLGVLLSSESGIKNDLPKARNYLRKPLL